MPYIDQHTREELKKDSPCNVGELTYVLYKTCKDFWGTTPGPSFGTGAEVLAALETTKQEFYRRHLGPYEDRKREENGDV